MNESKMDGMRMDIKGIQRKGKRAMPLLTHFLSLLEYCIPYSSERHSTLVLRWYWYSASPHERPWSILTTNYLRLTSSVRWENMMLWFTIAVIYIVMASETKIHVYVPNLLSVRRNESTQWKVLEGSKQRLSLYVCMCAISCLPYTAH